MLVRCVVHRLSLLTLPSFDSLLFARSFLGLLDILGLQLIQEIFVTAVHLQILKLLVNFALKCGALIIDGSQLHCFVVTLFLICLELSRCLTCLLFDISEELQEVLCVFLEHLLRADETELTHFIEVS